MLSRVLEPEAMDTDEAVAAYDAMDHRAVNAAFAADALGLAPSPVRALELGAGTARIALALCAAHPTVRVTGVDLSAAMLRRGARNVAEAGCVARVGLVVADVTRLPYAPGDFDLVLSNSLVHHLPEPARFFAALVRLSAPGVAVFVRDLLRPASEAARDALVDRYAAADSDTGRALFRASLHASLTLDEVRALVAASGLDGATVAQTSDRHWTLTRPAR